MSFYSMTGYASVQMGFDEYILKCEIKSFNHKYLEIKTKLPKDWNIYEYHIRKKLASSFHRGYFDVNIRKITQPQKTFDIIFSDDFCEPLIMKFKHLIEKYNLEKNIDVSSIVALSSVLDNFSNDENSEEVLNNKIFPLIETSFEKLREVRKSEGAFLIDEIRKNLESVESCRGSILTIWHKSIKDIEKKTKEKIFKILNEKIELDNNRILQEVAIYIDKIDIEEEIKRLKCHIENMGSLIEKRNNGSESIGKKLDFILQEINRETNTIASKAQDSSISHSVIEMKNYIEKMREQAQNIE